jgi:precorrin-8X/cobalt-precorrin-8 methylmutase
MVAVAINRHLAERFGCRVYCALDRLEVTRVARDEGGTRSAHAIRLIGRRLHEAIVAIGNSPTALFALIDLITKKKVAPTVVIGMPVGFVQAREAKEELMELDIPYISIVGTRGGSALAAATINALLGLAKRSAF